MSNTYNLDQNQAQHSKPAAELETFLRPNENAAMFSLGLFGRCAKIPNVKNIT